MLVLDEIRTLRADRLAIAASAAVTYRSNDLGHLAPQQPAALLRAPAGTRLGTPVCAQGCDLTQGLSRGIEVQKLMPLVGSSPSRLDQQGYSLPYPWRSIGAKEDVICLGDLQALPGGSEQGAHRIWPCERGVNAGGKAGRLLPLGLHHLHD